MSDNLNALHDEWFRKRDAANVANSNYILALDMRVADLVAERDTLMSALDEWRKRKPALLAAALLCLALACVVLTALVTTR